MSDIFNYIKFINNVFKEFSPLIPIVLTFATALLAYFCNQKLKRNEQFYSQSCESLKYASSPLFIETQEILGTTDFKNRVEKIQLFFNKYKSENSSIYKIGYYDIIQIFYKIEPKFENYLVKENKDEWDAFWKEFESFCSMIKQCYWTNVKVVYGNYRWEQYISLQPYLIKTWCGFFKTFYEFTAVIVKVSFWIFSASAIGLLIENIFNKQNDIQCFFIYAIQYSFLFLIGSIIAWCFLITVPNVQKYLELTKCNDRIIDTLIDKYIVEIENILKVLISKLLRIFKYKKQKNINSDIEEFMK